MKSDSVLRQPWLLFAFAHTIVAAVALSSRVSSSPQADPS